MPRVGDHVIISDAGDFVTEILPRINELERPPVANIDLIVVVASLRSPLVDTVMLDAFLLTAEAAGIDAMLCLNKCDIAPKEECAALCEMYEKAEELGGLVSGEHGIGYAKKDFLKKQYGETPIALMQGIKKVFDEKNILNPGKVCF